MIWLGVVVYHIEKISYVAELNEIERSADKKSQIF
jgi:hypothetical protein